VHARDAWWYEKHHPEETTREQTAHIHEEAEHGGIHMPDQSWYPLIAAGSLLVAGLFFAVSNYPAAIGAVAMMAAAIYLWSLEGPGGYHVHPHEEASGHENPRPQP
jgi:cytochrome c oxidase subunit 1